MSTTNGRIYMNDDMLESYANYNEAANSFLDGIALENIMLDTDIQMEFDLGDHDVFSDHAMEAIGETVKNMASKAKSNFVTYAKKLINFLFGWLIRFFQGTTNVKKAIASSYDKARTYLKKLNELESKARSYNKEEQIEITDFGNCVLVGLTMIQCIIWSTVNLGDGLKEVAGKYKEGDPNRPLEMIQVLCSKMTNLFATIGAIDVKNTSKLLSQIKMGNYDVSKLLKVASSSSAKRNLINDAKEEAAKDTNEKVSKGSIDNEKQADAFTGTAEDLVAGKLTNKFKARLEQTAKYMSEPSKESMTIVTAYEELRTKLNLFISMSKANKWDFEKNIKAAEKVRRGIEKEINSLNISNVNDEKLISTLLQRVINVGNLLGQVQKSVGVVVKQLTRCIDGMTADVAKLGSKLVKIGDTE